MNNLRDWYRGDGRDEFKLGLEIAKDKSFEVFREKFGWFGESGLNNWP